MALITQVISSRAISSGVPAEPNPFIHRNTAPSRCSEPASSPEGEKNRTSAPEPDSPGPPGRSSQGARAAEVLRCPSALGANATSSPATRRPSSGEIV